MENKNDFRILIIDDNPAIHMDFEKILRMEKINANIKRLNKLLFVEESQKPEVASFEGQELPIFLIDSASQGEEGVLRIQEAMEKKEPYALAFVDIRMPPGIDGIETIKRIWALDREIQIVICTAYSDYTWDETIEELGVNDNLLIIKKPFDSLAVRQLVCALTKKWHLMQESKNREKILEDTVKIRTDSLKQSVSLLEHQATHDTLTNLPNRALLMERMKQQIDHAKKAHLKFLVFFIDLDRFKLINDSFNHETGDELLKMVAKRLQEITREEDTIGRLSGDEFVFIALLSESKVIDSAATIAQKILNKVSDSIVLEQREILMSASLGISIYPDDGTTAEELLHNADLAMYRAKALGGNRFQMYTPEMQEKCLQRLEKESDLRRALIQKEFFLEYQPQYTIKDHKLIGVETLIRWNHPTKGVLLPLEFIPLAEEIGLIVPLGEWLIQAACQQNKTWQQKGLPFIPIAVNVATKQFIQPNFIEIIKNILSSTELEPKYLEVEVTENVILSTPSVLDAIKELKKMGVNIIIDDFGTGNSGLNYLQKIPIDQLKIDKSFIQNIHSSRSDEVIIEAIIDMANTLNLQVVAEGIETDDQLKFLEDLSCHKFQGFYFNKPISAEEFEKLTQKHP